MSSYDLVELAITKLLRLANQKRLIELSILKGVLIEMTKNPGSTAGQVKMEENDEPRAILTSFEGLVEFSVMHFVLCNVPTIFQ